MGGQTQTSAPTARPPGGSTQPGGGHQSPGTSSARNGSGLLSTNSLSPRGTGSGQQTSVPGGSINIGQSTISANPAGGSADPNNPTNSNTYLLTSNI